jgi:hypothetical protein
MVLRTNPKFAGNVKLMVDSSDNMFIDTFKVSDTLSDKKFRKQRVSANSTFSSDIRRVFENIPSGEMYKLDSGNVLDITLPKTELHKQYNTTYSYGARLLEDNLYPEDYSMLAPLWINSNLPDFFGIFRLSGAFNPETYDGSDMSEIAKRYISESDLVKTWSIRPENNLGKYLQTHLKEMNTVQSPVFLPLSEYDHNVWNGISVKKGLICSSQETSYQFEKAAENFTDTNAFISSGFERNNILCPNLINIEFAFNDDSANMYEMNRYFGFYMTENTMFKVSYYKDSSSSNSFSILSMDGNDHSSFFSTGNDPKQFIFDDDGYVNSDHRNRIFAINDDNRLYRITKLSQINDIHEIEKYCNRIDNNIFSTNVTRRNIDQFITIGISSSLQQGNHLRVIDTVKNVVWEIYAIEREIAEGQSYFYCSSSSYDGYPKVYRNAFSSRGSIEDQVHAIKDAFNEFNKFDVSTGFFSTVTSGSTFSIVADIGTTSKFVFQHITPTPNAEDKIYSNENVISLFGRNDIPINYSLVSYDASFGPIDFELHGDRKSIEVDFIRTSGITYAMSTDVRDKFQPYMYYKNIFGWNELIGSFDVSINGHLSTIQYVKDPTVENDVYLINVSNEVETVGSAMNVYSPKSINISLMGVNSVKDFDFTVYDSRNLSESKSEYDYKRELDTETWYNYIIKGETVPITARGSYVITWGSGDITIGGTKISYVAPFGFNTFDSSALIYARSNTGVTYAALVETGKFEGLASSYSEEKISDYYVNNSTLKYSLTTPYVTKWVMQGVDCRNNEMRLALFSRDVSAFTVDVSSNFIPVLESDIFAEEISFPSFKYLSLGEYTWKDYVYFDVNDAVQLDGSTRTTIKKAMLENPYVDVFSKIMLSSVGVNKTKNRTSIMSYNKYKNSVDTVYSGLKISLMRNNNILQLPSIENYNKFKFGFITTASRNYENNKPIEVFINENTKTIFMIWYQGADILNYNFRDTVNVPGKSILNNVSSNRNFNYFYGSDDSSTYSFVKSQFYLRTDSIGISTVSTNSTKSSFTYEESSPLLQTYHNTAYGSGRVFNSYARDNSVNGEIYEPHTDTYNNFNGKFEYVYSPSSITASSKVVNHANIYRTNKNFYRGEISNIKLLDSLIRNNQIHFYVIRKDKIYDNYTFGEDSFSLSLNPPKTFKGKLMTHNGAYFPKFNNVLNFSSNESQAVISSSKRDFISCNTNLISHDNIRQLWYNKVVKEVTEADINEKNSIDVKNGFNVFSSSWDRGYFTTYNANIEDNVKNSDANGYESSVELPSFFGSKLVKLPRMINLSEWDALNSTIYFSGSEISIRLNLSLSLQRMFRNESTFISNWAKLPNGAKYIDQYIKDTIQNYYDINLRNIEVKLYSKMSETLGISSYSSGMNEMISNNFSSELIYENQEYFYVINIKNSHDKMSYHADIKISQK